LRLFFKICYTLHPRWEEPLAREIEEIGSGLKFLNCEKMDNPGRNPGRAAASFLPLSVSLVIAAGEQSSDCQTALGYSYLYRASCNAI
jgi:hypothetical protein